MSTITGDHQVVILGYPQRWGHQPNDDNFRFIVGLGRPCRSLLPAEQPAHKTHSERNRDHHITSCECAIPIPPFPAVVPLLHRSL